MSSSKAKGLNKNGTKETNCVSRSGRLYAWAEVTGTKETICQLRVPTSFTQVLRWPVLRKPFVSFALRPPSRKCGGGRYYENQLSALRSDLLYAGEEVAGTHRMCGSWSCRWQWEQNSKRLCQVKNASYLLLPSAPHTMLPAHVTQLPVDARPV